MYYAIQTSMGSKIFETWKECAAYRDLAPKNARYKKFPTKEEAQEFLGDGQNIAPTAGEKSFNPAKQASLIDEKHAPASANSWGCADVIAYTDGSFDVHTGVWGYGVVIYNQKGDELAHYSGNGTEFSTSRNVTGEIHGVVRAVQEAIRQSCKSIRIRYDYTGIECWVNGTWRAKTELTSWYRNLILRMSNDIHVKFEKVAAHTGVAGNEKADQLAKAACMK